MVRRKGRRGAWAGLLMAPWLLGACVPNDLGAPCHLLRADNTQVTPRPGHVTVQSGAGECEQFTCASFNGSSPVCTRACDAEGEACENGWTCRHAILGPENLEEVRDRTQGHDRDGDGVDDYEQLLSGLNEALLCTPD